MTSETTVSCADLDQTMAINASIAVTAFGLIQNWYFNHEFTAHQHNVSLSHGVSTEFINGNYLARCSEQYHKHHDFRSGAAPHDLGNHVATNRQRHENFVNKMKLEQKRAEEAALVKKIAEEAAAAAKIKLDAKDKEESEINVSALTEEVLAATPKKRKSRATSATLEIGVMGERVLQVMDSQVGSYANVVSSVAVNSSDVTIQAAA